MISDPEGRLILSACSPDVPLWSGPLALDWDRLLRLAGIHAVTPLLARRMSPLGVVLPSAIQDRLKARCDQIALTNLSRVAELFDVLDLLEGVGVRAVPFKGPILAVASYGDLALREFVDLDVLVAREDVSAALEALRGVGYTLTPDLGDEPLRYRVRFGHELLLTGPDGSLLELQWDLVPRSFGIDLDVAGAIARAITVRVGDREVRSLSPEDLVLVLAMHAGKHLWERLAWAVDLDRTVRSQPNLAWAEVRARAEAGHAMRLLRLAPAVASRALGSSWAGPASTKLGPDPAVQPMAAKLIAAWFRPGEPAGREEPNPNFHADIFRLHDHALDGLRHLWRLLVTPTDEDVALAPFLRALPGAFVPLRAGRLISRFSGGTDPRRS